MKELRGPRHMHHTFSVCLSLRLPSSARYRSHLVTACWSHWILYKVWLTLGDKTTWENLGVDHLAAECCEAASNASITIGYEFVTSCNDCAYSVTSVGCWGKTKNKTKQRPLECYNADRDSQKVFTNFASGGTSPEMSCIHFLQS